jgi:hypothetical protein
MRRAPLHRELKLNGTLRPAVSDRVPTHGRRRPRARPGCCFRPEGGARRAAAGRSLLDECDHHASDRGVIATDGEHSCVSTTWRDPFATHPSASLDDAGARFRHLGGLHRTLGTNGSRSSGARVSSERHTGAVSGARFSRIAQAGASVGRCLQARAESAGQLALALRSEVVPVLVEL